MSAVFILRKIRRRATRAKPRDKLSQKERIKEITDQLEAGVQAVFESDAYKDYLKCMSKFHSYSLNNCLLIAQQMPEATCVAGYKAWQKDHGRYVRKGEKGIKILAPCRFKKEIEDDQKPGEKKEIEYTGFKITHVFDLAQTEGKELPTIGAEELSGDVAGYKKLFKALNAISPVPIRFEDIEGGAKGYYSDSEQRIAIKSGMSEAQTVKTMIHEIAHATYHAKDRADPAAELDRSHKETEAESIAYCVASALAAEHGFKLDTSEYSFPYVASWAKGKDTTVLKESLERIRTASDEMITGIDQSLEKQMKREQQNRDQER